MAKTVAKKSTVARKPAQRSGAVKRATTGRSGAAQLARPKAKRTAQKARSASSQVPASAVDAQVLAHGLNGLLHTMQTVQQFEETLCSLMHALRRGRATGALLQDLREVLEQLPAQDDVHEVDALRDAIAA